MKLLKKNKSLEKYVTYDVCRFCFSKKIYSVINLGYIPLAGGFLKSKKFFNKEKFYPLELYFCTNCYLLQTNTVINKDTLFRDYFYFSSKIKTLTNHFYEFSNELKNLFPDTKKRFVVEIGCNDGALIRSMEEKGFKALGIDPASNVVKPLIKKGVPIINDYFTEELAKKIVKKYKKADAIVSFNTLAHIENMHDVILGVKNLLKKNGILIFGVHYLGSLLKKNQYDMIYHEHQYYYSLLTLTKFLSLYNMEVYDVKKTRIHGGSAIFFVQNKSGGRHKTSKKVKETIRKEKRGGFDKIETYTRFSKRINRSKTTLLTLLDSLKKRNKKLIGYGASGRATIMMNYCGIDGKILDYVVDDSPIKHNLLTPGNHLKIKSSDHIYKDRPDYILLFAWSFLKEIKKRHNFYFKQGGKFIVPLPTINIIGNDK